MKKLTTIRLSPEALENIRVIRSFVGPLSVTAIIEVAMYLLRLWCELGKKERMGCND